MTDIYFGLKIFIPLAIFSLLILIFLIILAVVLVKSAINKRKVNYLKSIGFERYLHSVSAFGNGETWGYKRKTNEYDYEAVKECQLKEMSLKDVKRKFKKV